MTELLLALTLVFGAAAVLLLVATRLSAPVIPFYLLAGIVIGAVIEEGQVIDLAQWGIAFLVFLFGVHVDLAAVRTQRPSVVAVAVGQATLVGAGAMGTGWLLGLDPLNAVYLGIAAALSSSLVAVSYLDDPTGVLVGFERVAETIHFVEDVLGVLAVLALSAFVYGAEPAPEQIAVAGGLLAMALVIRHLLFDRLTAHIRGDEEVMMLLGISAIVGFIALAEAAGLSIVVGAFAAGIAVADDYPHSLELVDTIDDLEDFFTPIFFVTIGALLAVPGLETLVLAAVLVVIVLIVNPLVTAVGLAAGGHEPRTAVLAGLTIDQVSALSLFVALEAAGAGTIDRSVFDAIVIAAVVTMLVSTFTARHRASIHGWLHEHGVSRLVTHRQSTSATVPAALSGHVILVGLKHAAPWVLAEATRWRDVVVIADDVTELADARAADAGVVFGDVLAERTWQRARIEEASLVISLTPEPDQRTAVLDQAGPTRVVRVDDEGQVQECLAGGADGVLFPDAVAGAMVQEDLAGLLDGSISPEAFERIDGLRGRYRRHSE